MEKKLQQIEKKHTAWVDTLHIAFPSEIAYTAPINNDFTRERTL
jgi:hypothetical protein